MVTYSGTDRTEWVFALTSTSFQVDREGPLAEEISSVFPRGFIPSPVRKYVHFRFENEDGSPWGGEDLNLTASFEEFFKYGPKDQRPTWMSFRAWDKLTYHTSRRNWDFVENKDLTREVLESRYLFYKEGMYQKYGFPVRMVLTLE
jgi:hypothetical protein